MVKHMQKKELQVLTNANLAESYTKRKDIVDDQAEVRGHVLESLRNDFSDAIAEVLSRMGKDPIFIARDAALKGIASDLNYRLCNDKWLASNFLAGTIALNEVLENPADNSGVSTAAQMERVAGATAEILVRGYLNPEISDDPFLGHIVKKLRKVKDLTDPAQIAAAFKIKERPAQELGAGAETKPQPAPRP